MAIKGYLSGNHFNRLSVWLGFTRCSQTASCCLPEFTITEDLILGFVSCPPATHQFGRWSIHILGIPFDFHVGLSDHSWSKSFERLMRSPL